MRNITIYFSALLFCFFAFFSCQKIALKPSDNIVDSISPKNSARLMACGSYPIVSADYIPQDGDSIERDTQLGVQLTNPYLIPNMQQAYANLGLSTAYAVLNNLYVRFLPTNVDQLATLDSIMDAQGLELFDMPVDYQVLYEGDYYQDPSIPDSMITWQYAVVPPSFQFPAGIQHETLASLHIPTDSYTAVETEAERLASIQDSINMSNNTSMTMTTTVTPYSNTKNGTIKPNVLQPDNFQECPDGFIWDPVGRECIPDRPPVLDPPPPAADAAIPAGNIFVFDTNMGTEVGVRKVRVVARRWFKIERTYTDNSGHFTFSKRFKHKVRIIEKFKNEYANIRAMRGLSLWQMLFATKRTLGVYSGDKSNITFFNDQGGPLNSKDDRYWAAATTLNSVQEYRDYAVSESIGLPPLGLKILLSNWGHGSGATPMFAKRASDDLPTEFETWYMGAPVQIIASVIFTLKHQVDIVGSYNFGGAAYLVSDNMKELFYHELTHAAHYQALGDNWYTTFVNSELFEVISNISSGYSPYGNGSNSQSSIVALGEGWAYHIGHYFTDKRYGNSSSDLYDNGQQEGYYNGSPTAGLSSHLNLLENFNPNSATDHFKWIPTGLFYDLLDPANETNPPYPVTDLVSGYTNAQMFGTFQSNIYTLQDYRARLLQTVSNPTSGQVTGLFAQYHY